MISTHAPEGRELIAPSSYRRTVAEQLGQLLVGAPETLPVEEVAGRIVAADILAPANSPAFTNSQMDGYALTATAARRENRVFMVGQDLAAGASVSGIVADHNTAYPIMTGAALPAGYDCVVPEEAGQPLGRTEGSFAAASSQVHLPVAEPGQFVRYPGEDIAAGQTLIPAGTLLTPVHVGVLATQGITEITVRARPHVLVLTGGDEMSSTPEPGHIFDANGPMLSALLTRDAAVAQRLSISDNPQELITCLQQVLEDFHPALIVSSGGISHGKYEVVRKALALLGDGHKNLVVENSWFGYIAQQPGGPQGIATLTHTAQGQSRQIGWLALPGNPVSTLVSYTLLLQPLLVGQAPERWGKLTGNTVSGLPAKTRYLRGRARLITTDTKGTVEVQLVADPAAGSHLLHRASTANALIEVEAGRDYRPGDSLRWFPLDSHLVNL